MDTHLQITKAKAALAGFAASALLLSGGAAFADRIHNTIDSTIDTNLETLHLVEGGATSTVQYRVKATSNDGESNCNLDASGDAATFSVKSSNTAVATVSPVTLTFDSCSDVHTVTVTPVAEGTANIRLTQTANTTDGSFGVGAAAFTVVVADADADDDDTTPPVIKANLSTKANANGWHKSAVTVSWTVTDSESAISSKTGCDTQTETEETSGKTFTCTATSSGGTATKSVTIKLDTTAPVIDINSPEDDEEYDLHEDVEADYSATDALSGIASIVGTVSDGADIDTDTAGNHTFTVTAKDKAGNTATLSTQYSVESNDDDDDEDHDNDDDDDDDDEDNDHGGRHDKASVCHKGKHTLHISTSAVKAHVRHGDKVGNCKK